MKTSNLLTTLTTAFSAPERDMAFMLSGTPGIGKTGIVAQAAEKAGKRVVTIGLPTCEAVDLRGMPQIVNGVTRWASPLPREGEGVLLLDEVSSAPLDVQVAAHHVVWAERGSDMSLAPGWHVVLTGNRAGDKTLHRPMGAPLRNRIVMIDVEVDVDSWSAWAARNSAHPHIIGFIRWLPDELISKETPAEGAFPSPRAWMRASRILNFACTPEVEAELLAGTIGQAAAVKFSAYLVMARTLPDIEAIMRAPGKAPIPKEPSLCYALTSSLAQHTCLRQVSAMAYVARLPAEYGVLYIRDIRDRYDIRADQDVRDWVGRHIKLFEDDPV